MVMALTASFQRRFLPRFQSISFAIVFNNQREKVKDLRNRTKS